jgi:hypothetical protein
MNQHPMFRKGVMLDDPGPGPYRRYVFTADAVRVAGGLWQAMATLTMAGEEPHAVRCTFATDGTMHNVERVSE